MQSRAALALALALACAPAACILTIDPLPSAPANEGDGAAPDASEGGGDAPSPRDGAPQPDGAHDAGSDVVANVRWCDSLVAKPMFCEDFDVPPLRSEWTSRIDPETSLAVNTNDAKSAPASMLVTTVDNPSQKVGAFLKFVPPLATVSKAHFTFDLRIDQAGSYAEIAYLRLDSKHSFYFRADTSGVRTFTAEAYLADGGVPAHDISLSLPQTLTTWTHFDVSVDLAAAQRTVTVLVDGAQVAKQVLESTLYVPGSADVEPGIPYVPDGGTAWAIRFDNVTVDWQ